MMCVLFSLLDFRHCRYFHWHLLMMINHGDDDDCCAALNYGFVCDVKMMRWRWNYMAELSDRAMYTNRQVDTSSDRDLTLRNKNKFSVRKNIRLAYFSDRSMTFLRFHVNNYKK
jgi:hypothetical protein